MTSTVRDEGLRRAARLPRSRRLGGWALSALALLPAMGLLFMDRPARWLVIDDGPTVVDAAVVLGGDPDYERTSMAASLLLAGQARLLILTGGESGPGDSSASLREKALALGVPAERIRTESVSRSTREALMAIEPLLRREGVRSVALVTSPYHQRRAFLAARKAWPGIRIRNRPARPSFWTPREWWRRPTVVISEYAKLVVYASLGWL